MSKAEDLAKALYPDWEMTGVSYVDGQEESMVRIQRVAYIKGYQQAEKDLELTLKDVEIIINAFLDFCIENNEREKTKRYTNKEYSQEVLKRFKERKEL